MIFGFRGKTYDLDLWSLEIYDFWGGFFLITCWRAPALWVPYSLLTIIIYRIEQNMQ